MESTGQAQNTPVVEPPQSYAVHGDMEQPMEEVEDDNVSDIAMNASRHAYLKRKASLGSAISKIPKTKKLNVDLDGVLQTVDELSATQKKYAKNAEAMGAVMESVQQSQRKYNLKIEGLPMSVEEPFKFLLEFYTNGLKLVNDKQKITEADFRDMRLIPIKSGKKILLLEFVSFELKRKTLRACSNLAQYLFEGKHRINVKDDKTIKDRKREYCAVLARKLIELVAKDHPTILKAEDEKLKIVRVDCLTSKHRAPTRWDVLVSEVHKLEVEHSGEAKAIIAKINATSKEINNM